jgi:protein TonB
VAKSSPEKEVTASVAKPRVHQDEDSDAIDSSKAAPPVASKTTAAKTNSQPIVIKNKAAADPPAGNDAPVVSVTSIASATGATIPNFMGASKALTPTLQRLNVSQGVSRGLLIKQVQPNYPPSALRMHVEGSVQMLATLSKNGDISEVKILSGDPQLSQAAANAVKQWKYKPYLLNGEPVEIQTQITVNFKLPR